MAFLFDCVCVSIFIRHSESARRVAECFKKAHKKYWQLFGISKRRSLKTSSYDSRSRFARASGQCFTKVSFSLWIIKWCIFLYYCCCCQSQLEWNACEVLTYPTHARVGKSTLAQCLWYIDIIWCFMLSSVCGFAVWHTANKDKIKYKM